MKMLPALIAAAAVSATALPASATTLLADTGWQDDVLLEPNAALPIWATANSAWDFTVSVPSLFRVTDAFLPGDNLYLFSGATQIASEVFGAMPSVGIGTDYDAGWTSSAFAKIEYLVNPGTYSFTIKSDGAGGLPAGFGVRLDSLSSAVPEPATWGLLIIGFGLMGATLRGVRRRSGLAAFVPT